MLRPRIQPTSSAEGSSDAAEGAQAAVEVGLPFQVDPYRGTALYQIWQNEREVGKVFVVGNSDIDSVENWYLYSTYTWPSFDNKRVVLDIRWESATLPEGQTVTTYRTYLERKGMPVKFYVESRCAGVQYL